MFAALMERFAEALSDKISCCQKTSHACRPVSVSVRREFFVLSRLPLRAPAERASGYAAAPVRASRAAQPLTARSVSGVTALS